MNNLSKEEGRTAEEIITSLFFTLEKVNIAIQSSNMKNTILHDEVRKAMKTASQFKSSPVQTEEGYTEKDLKSAFLAGRYDTNIYFEEWLATRKGR